jgi:hypothetical protein
MKDAIALKRHISDGEQHITPCRNGYALSKSTDKKGY